MSKPEKAGTDDLKRMLRRLERIETEKAERSQARADGPVRTRDLAALPEAKRRPEMPPPVRNASEYNPPPRRTLANSLDELASQNPKPPPLVPRFVDPAAHGKPKSSQTGKPVSVLTDPREFTKRGGPKSEGVSAGFVIAVVSTAFLVTLTTVWLSGGFDRVLLQYAPQSSAPATPPVGTAPGNVVASEPTEALDPRKGERLMPPDDAPAGAQKEVAPNHVLAPPAVERSGSGGMADSASGAAADSGSEVDTSAKTTASSGKRTSDEIGPPPAPVAALQTPQTPAPVQPAPIDPSTIELTSPDTVSAQPGVPLPFPVSLEAGSSDLRGYYLIVSGLKRGSTFSRGIELLFDTWQIPAPFLKGLQLTTTPGFTRHMNLKVELRGPTGEPVKQTTLTIELPGTARSAVGLEGLETAGDRPPTDSAQSLIDKAEVFLDNGSLQGARMLLERAATYGAGYAAMLLATSYDPQYASHFSEGDDSQADAAQAKRWYERALELGVSAAGERLKSVD